jgi:hypothetical protein
MMTKHFPIIAITSATLFLAAASLPAQALDLSDTLGGLGNTLGKATETVGGTVNGVTGKSSKATVNLTSNGELSALARSQMMNGIEAEAQALSPKRLARLCLNIGGGEGCGSGNRSELLGIIDNRLEVLSDKRIASLCLSTGADGCGGGDGSGAGSANPSAAVPGAAAPESAAPESAAPANASARSRNLSSIAGNLSSRDVIIYKKRCSSVLRNPQAYENDIVQICKLIN